MYRTKYSYHVFRESQRLKGITDDGNQQKEGSYMHAGE